MPAIVSAEKAVRLALPRFLPVPNRCVWRHVGELCHQRAQIREREVPVSSRAPAQICKRRGGNEGVASAPEAFAVRWLVGSGGCVTPAYAMIGGAEVTGGPLGHSAAGKLLVPGGGSTADGILRLFPELTWLRPAGRGVVGEGRWRSVPSALPAVPSAWRFGQGAGSCCRLAGTPVISPFSEIPPRACRVTCPCSRVLHSTSPSKGDEPTAL